jgi:hypothetical protein
MTRRTLHRYVTTLVVSLSLAVAAGCQDPVDGNHATPDATGDVAEDVHGFDAADVSDATDAIDTSADATDMVDAADTTGDAVSDASSDAEDTSGDASADADTGSMQFPLEGFGDISGTCNVLDDELSSTQPSYIDNAIDFGDDPYDNPQDKPLLTVGGMEIIDDGNAGGSSLYSEVFAYEVLYRCELAELLKTETEITYTNPQGKITDLLVEVDGVKIGVSVTRALAFPFDDPYTVQQATNLLEDKLADVRSSSANVSPEDAWEKQILHVIAYAPGHEDSLETAFAQLDASVKADTIVWVTVSNGSDDFLY